MNLFFNTLDTFFINGKGSYLHKMTVPNRFIRIAPNGRISYSQRLTIKASCQMNLRKFPLDSQSCPLIIGSFGHDAGDVVYRVSIKYKLLPISMAFDIDYPSFRYLKAF
jgi:gamma-aminobutyric acid receptor subunit alpha